MHGGQAVIALQKQLNLLDQIPVGECVLRRDGTVLFWNTCLENWTFLSRAQMVGRRIDYHFPHLSQLKYTRRLRQTFEGGFTIIFSSQIHPHFLPCSGTNGELRVQHTIVTAIPAADGVGFDALLSIQDVTDLTQQIHSYKQIQERAWAEVKQRQTAEEQLRHDRDLLNAILNSSASAIVVTDTQGQIVFANCQGEEILGLVKSRVVGQIYHVPQWKITDFSESPLPQTCLPTAEVLQTGESVFNLQRTIAWADGKRHFVSINGSPLWNGESITSVVFSISDMTPEKQATDELSLRDDQERIVDRVVHHIRQSLNLREVLQTTVTEIQRLLRADRVLVYRLTSTDGNGKIVAEAGHPDFPSLMKWTWQNTLLQQSVYEQFLDAYKYPKIQTIADLSQSDLNPEYKQLLQSLSVKARLAIPILLNHIQPFAVGENDATTGAGATQTAMPWGWLIVHQCSAVRSWQPEEIDLLRRLESQLTVAIYQSELLQQVHHLNINLERQVHARTLELQQALTLESTLKRITDRVRDSLDEDQILQAVVEELGEALEVYHCDTTLYGSSQGSLNIQHQYTHHNAPPVERDHHLHVEELFEIYDQLFRGQYFACCPLKLLEPNHRAAILTCPVLDDQGILGDLWLFRPAASSFSELEIRLVQQVSNQCAIAIRQAQLYKASQQKIEELTKLNHVKDDFLNTISHELRTPLVGIRMALQTLELLFDCPERLTENWTQASQYFHILEDECQREAKLIDDLLNLTRLEAGAEPIVCVPVHLESWLSHIAETFEARMQQRQQYLKLDLAAGLPPLITDITILERILIELLNNAYKYTSVGETITVLAQVIQSEDPKMQNHENNQVSNISIAMRQIVSYLSKPMGKLTASRLSDTPRQYLDISVCNTGIEISASEQSRIFDKFYRVPHIDPWNHGGTGLGLSLAKCMAEYLGGTIQVKSENNTTQFTLKLAIDP